MVSFTYLDGNTQISMRAIPRHTIRQLRVINLQLSQSSLTGNRCRSMFACQVWKAPVSLTVGMNVGLQEDRPRWVGGALQVVENKTSVCLFPQCEGWHGEKGEESENMKRWQVPPMLKREGDWSWGTRGGLWKAQQVPPLSARALHGAVHQDARICPQSQGQRTHIWGTASGCHSRKLNIYQPTCASYPLTSLLDPFHITGISRLKEVRVSAALHRK